MRMRFVAVAAALAIAPMAAAQMQERDPRETVSAVVSGTKKVTVEYGRPALKGRPLKDLLTQLPPDRIWRAGSDQVTTLTADVPVVIGGKSVPAGKYSVYLHAPAEGDYALVLNSDPGIALKIIYPAAPPAVADALWPRLDGYDKIVAKEVVRIPLKKSATAEPMDRFKVGFDPVKNGASNIILTWGGESWTADVKTAK